MSKINRNPKCRKENKKVGLIEYLQHGDYRYIMLVFLFFPFVVPYIFCTLCNVIWPDLIFLFIGVMSLISIAVAVAIFFDLLKIIDWVIYFVMIIGCILFSFWFLVINKSDYYESQINALYEEQRLQNERRDSLEVKQENRQNDISKMLQGIMIGLSIK